jgi:hypothetical protein
VGANDLGNQTKMKVDANDLGIKAQMKVDENQAQMKVDENQAQMKVDENQTLRMKSVSLETISKTRVAQGRRCRGRFKGGAKKTTWTSATP